MVDSEGEPMKVAACGWLADQPDTVMRMADNLCASIAEAMEPLRETNGLVGLAAPLLLVALPAERIPFDDSLVARIRRHLSAAFPRGFAHMEMLRSGHAGGLVALETALAMVRTQQRQPVIIAGSDCWLDPDTLEWLEETSQLHGAGERNNAWGFIPGEAAGAALLLSSAAARAVGIAPLSYLVATGLGKEDKLIRSGEVCLGKGLSRAFGSVLEAWPGEQVTDVYCDMNGEPYRADEYGFTVTRTRQRFRAASDFIAPADCWGDVGAASGPLAVVLATIAQLKMYSRGPLGLVWGSSDGGERAAALLRAASNC